MTDEIDTSNEAVGRLAFDSFTANPTDLSATLRALAVEKAEAEAEQDRLREILRTIISRADHAKELCANGYPVSAYNLASAILGQIGSEAANLRQNEGGE